MYRWMVLVGLVCACSSDGAGKADGGPSDADTARDGTPQGDSGEGDGQGAAVAATARLLDPYGVRLEGVSVSNVDSDATCTTDERGECVLEVAGESGFQLAVVDDSVLEHRLFGQAGTEPFTTISFVATGPLTNQIYGLLGVRRDRSKGTIVVGLDNPDLSPATGASAAIDADSEVVFVLGARLPELGDTLVVGGQSIVTFVNVPPGPVTVTASGAEGTTCEVAPVRDVATHTIESVADAVSVVTFICE